MRGIENHRITKPLHNRNRPHVRHQIAIAERRAALRQYNLIIAACDDLLRAIFHILRREKLPFFDIHDFAGFRGGDQQIGLAAQKRRNLQHVRHVRDLRGLFRRMNIGDNRHVELPLNLGQDAQAALDSDAAIRRRRTAVGFIERGFENVRHAERRRNGFEAFGGLKDDGGIVLDDARPGNHHQLISADAHVAESHLMKRHEIAHRSP